MDKRIFRNILLMIAFAIIFTYALWHVDGLLKILANLIRILRPIIIGFAIAFVLNNPFSSIKRLLDKPFKKKKHEKLTTVVSLLIVYSAMFSIIIGIIIIIVPQFIDSASLLSDNFDSYMDNFKNLTNDIYQEFEKVIPDDFNVFNEIKNLFNNIPNIAKTIFFGAFGFSKNLVSVIVDIFLGLVISFYFLVGKKKLYTQIKKLIFAVIKTERADRIVDFMEHAKHTFSNFITGQLIESLILGVLCFIGMNLLNIFSFINFEYEFLISALICITSLMPIVGAFIGTIPAVLLLLIIDPIQAVWFVIFIIVLQEIEGNFIYPRVVGGKVGLPALWVLIAIIIGGGLYGVLGMLLSVPTMSIIYDYTKLKINEKLKKKQIEVT